MNPRLELPADPLAAAQTCLASPPPPDGAAAARSAAWVFAAGSSQAADAVRRLDAAVSDRAVWQGAAGDAFRAAVHVPAKLHLDQLADRLAGDAQALTGYANAVEADRPALLAAYQRVTEAVAARNAVPRPQAPVTAPMAATVPVGNPFPAVRAAEAADAECADAARVYAARYNAGLDTSAACAGALRRVDFADDLHNPHGFHAFLDAAARTASDVGKYAALAGVLALVVCPVAAPILFAVSAVASGVSLADDATRKWAYGENVSVGDLALDAVGAIPAAGTFKAGAEGMEAARAATGVARARAGLSSFRRGVRSESGQMYLTKPGNAWNDLRSGGLDSLRFGPPSVVVNDAKEYAQDLVDIPAGVGVAVADDHAYRPRNGRPAPLRAGLHWFAP